MRDGACRGVAALRRGYIGPRGSGEREREDAGCPAVTDFFAIRHWTLIIGHSSPQTTSALPRRCPGSIFLRTKSAFERFRMASQRIPNPRKTQILKISEVRGGELCDPVGD